MNFEDALLSLLLRQLRSDRIDLTAAGNANGAARLEELARALRITRDKIAKVYHVALNGRPLTWTISEGEFSFYVRGDRVADGLGRQPSTEDVEYEKNAANARKWLAVFREAFDA